MTTTSEQDLLDEIQSLKRRNANLQQKLDQVAGEMTRPGWQLKKDSMEQLTNVFNDAENARRSILSKEEEIERLKGEIKEEKEEFFDDSKTLLAVIHNRLLSEAETTRFSWMQTKDEDEQ